MSHDLLKLGYPHADHSHGVTTLVLFANCRLTYGSLTRFDKKPFELFARCLKRCEHTKSFFEIVVYLHSQLQRLFANVGIFFSNGNCRCIKLAPFTILLSF